MIAAAVRDRDLVQVGREAYRFAANDTASYDRVLADIWWEIGRGFVEYSHIVTAGSEILRRSV